MKKLFLMFTLFGAMLLQAQIPSWSVQASLPSTGRSSSIMFSVGGKVYLALGGNTTTTNQVWEFDTLTNNWTQKNNFPGVARGGAFAMVYNNKVYVGLGFDGTNYLTDIWEYTPSNDSWIQKT